MNPSNFFLHLIFFNVRTAAAYHAVHIWFQEKKRSDTVLWQHIDVRTLFQFHRKKSWEQSLFQGNCRNESLVFPGQAAPCCAAADPLAGLSAFQLLFTAAAVTVYSGIWCWSLLGTPSAFLLRIAVLGALYASSLIPYSPVVCGKLAAIQHLERLPWCRWHFCAAGAAAGSATDAVGYHTGAVPDTMLWACSVSPAAGGFGRTWDDSTPQLFLMANNNARRNTWKYLAQQCGWQKLFPPSQRTLPRENNNMILNIFF